MLMNMTITSKGMIVDYSHQSEDDFIYHHIQDILDEPGDLSSGVNGCIRAGAYERVCSILRRHGAPKPRIVETINDPEVELTYIVENG